MSENEFMSPEDINKVIDNKLVDALMLESAQ